MNRQIFTVDNFAKFKTYETLILDREYFLRKANIESILFIKFVRTYVMPMKVLEITRKNRSNNSHFSDLLISGNVGTANASGSIRTGDKKFVDSGTWVVVVIKINIPGICDLNGDGKVRDREG